MRQEQEDPVRPNAEELQAAADELRRRVGLDPVPPIPREFALLAVSRLLEELSRSVRGEHNMSPQVMRAAMEVARHITRSPSE